MMPFRMRRLAALLAFTLAGCASGGARETAQAPAWFEDCRDRLSKAGAAASEHPHLAKLAQATGADALYFCADADGASEDLAKELAAQKALGQLTIYVGATVKSEEKVKDVERNGASEQEVSATVDVAGQEVVIKQARVKKSVVQRVGRAYSAWAMIEWPRSEYEALLGAEKTRAMKALEIYLSAEKAVAELDLDSAKRELKEARELLGPTRSAIALDSEKVPNSAVLRTSIDSLGERIASLDQERKNVCAVGLVCMKDGSPTACRPSRVGMLRDAISHSGHKVSSDAPPDEVVSAILASSAPKVDAKIRASGCIVAVRLTSDLMEAGNPFTFVSVGGSAAIYDTASNRILTVHEIKPTKVGHVSYDGAMQKGFDDVTKQLAEKISASLPGR
jgi:hypothetical protein